MSIKIINNRIYFNDDNKAFVNARIDSVNSYAYIELLKVVPRHRNKHLASRIMIKVLSYIKNQAIKRIELNPLPLDSSGLTLPQLIEFYTKLGFKKSVNKKDNKSNLMLLIL